MTDGLSEPIRHQAAGGTITYADRRMSQIVYDRTMSDAEGLMWRLEKDPYLSSTFANVTILDRKPNFDLLRRRMDRTAMRIPRLRQRVQTSPGNVSAPVWVDDPDFDLDHHLRRIALPRPGTDRQLLDLATLITADPFDRTRPLWQFVIVEGLKGGRAALIEKLHHTITDGEGGVQLSLEFLDFERDAPELPIPTLDDELDGACPTDGSSGDSMRDLLAGSLRIPFGIVKQVRDLLADPAQIPDATTAAADTLRAILNELGDTEKARSPLWTGRSLRRHLEVATAPLDETRASARKLGGTLNTAFLTVAAEAASCYHAKLGEPVESLRGVDGDQHPHRELRAECVLARAHARAHGRHPDRRAVQGDPGVGAGRRRPVEAHQPRRDWPPSRRHCRRRSSPGSSASRHRPSTSRPRTCAAHRCRCSRRVPNSCTTIRWVR